MTKDEIVKTLCERIIEEGQKILSKGHNVKITCENQESKEIKNTINQTAKH